ncbi:hypothetical protein M0802_005143 [Mischocyttarus mexicanus]|nr:hypothetical protein M0802_005143 [Mischocyttarus mexicanus]
MADRQMNQQCKVCGEPAAGFHFGAFTCEGCKEDSLLLGLDDYKNSTSPSISSPESHNSDSSVEISERRAAFAGHPGFRPLHPHLSHSVAELSALGKEMMGLPFGFHLSGMSLIQPAFLPPPGLTMFPPYHLYSPQHAPSHPLIQTCPSPNVQSSSPILEEIPSTIPEPPTTTTTTVTVASTTMSTETIITNTDYKNSFANNNNNRDVHNQNVRPTKENNSSSSTENYSKRFYLDTVLKRQRSTRDSPSPRSIKTQSDRASSTSSSSSTSSTEVDVDFKPQDIPIDLSMKSSFDSNQEDELNIKEDSDSYGPPLKKRPAPMDLTTRS